MLAPTTTEVFVSPFKTALELRIKDQERTALIELLDMMESGALRHSPGSYFDGYKKAKSGFAFNMGIPCARVAGRERAAACNTVACIGGWACFLMTGSSDVEFVEKYVEDVKSPRLHTLFYPPDRINYNTVTVAEAAIALRGFLTTGKTSWKHVASDTSGE